jgi:large subunit ribosomal protein L30
VKKLLVTQKKSLIGRQDTQRETALGLGLRGLGTKVEVDNTPSFRGAIKKILHLVTVEEVERG